MKIVIFFGLISGLYFISDGLYQHSIGLNAAPVELRTILRDNHKAIDITIPVEQLREIERNAHYTTQMAENFQNSALYAGIVILALTIVLTVKHKRCA